MKKDTVKKIRLQDRDKNIIQFLKDFKCATTSTINKLYFSSNNSLRSCQRRLKYLEQWGYIKGYQESVISEKYWYCNRKPKNIKHALKLSEFVGELKSHNIELVKHKTPFKISNIIADSFMAIRYNNKNHIMFIEVEMGTKGFNNEKYEELFISRKYKDYFPVMPTVVVIANSKVKTSNNYRVINIKLDLSNIENILI